MDNLLKCHGRCFEADMDGTNVKGRISVDEGSVYLCQDQFDGSDCKNKLGYKYSWHVFTGSKSDLAIQHVSYFRFTDPDPAYIESYKDWQVGDKVTCLNQLDPNGEVIFRSGELVVLKWSGKEASQNYTCDELHREGYRLKLDPIPEEDEIHEFSMDEIAEKMGVPVEKLKIKKE